jgi:hypothetical protein
MPFMSCPSVEDCVASVIEEVVVCDVEEGIDVADADDCGGISVAVAWKL